MEIKWWKGNESLLSVWCTCFKLLLRPHLDVLMWEMACFQMAVTLQTDFGKWDPEHPYPRLLGYCPLTETKQRLLQDPDFAVSSVCLCVCFKFQVLLFIYVCSMNVCIVTEWLSACVLRCGESVQVVSLVQYVCVSVCLLLTHLQALAFKHPMRSIPTPQSMSSLKRNPATDLSKSTSYQLLNKVPVQTPYLSHSADLTPTVVLATSLISLQPGLIFQPLPQTERGEITG